MIKSLIVITGPTACGKTATAVALAKIIDGEVVSADSMQVYKGMDIGTAKPTMAERGGIPHHMLDIVNPNDDFSAAIFQEMAREAIADIHNRGKTPILAGGTGFYINSVVYSDALLPDNIKDDDGLRDALMKEPDIHQQLQEIDPVSAEAIHPNNIKRVARALAYYKVNGKPFSHHKAEKKSLYNASFYVLHRERALLYRAIDQRVETMITRGLEEEVVKLLEEGVGENCTAMQAIGYKEMLPYLKGQYSLAEAIQAIQQGSRRYAKRQLTWFRHQMQASWISMDEHNPEEAARRIQNGEKLSGHNT